MNMMILPSRLQHSLRTFSSSALLGNESATAAWLALAQSRARKLHTERSQPQHHEAPRPPLYKYQVVSPTYKTPYSRLQAERGRSLADLEKYICVFGPDIGDAPSTWAVEAKQELQDTDISDWPIEIQSWYSSRYRTQHRTLPIKQIVNRVLSLDGPIPHSLLKYHYHSPPCTFVYGRESSDVTTRDDLSTTSQTETLSQYQLLSRQKHTHYYIWLKPAFRSHPNIQHLIRANDMDGGLSQGWIRVALSACYDHMSYSLERTLRDAGANIDSNTDVGVERYKHNSIHLSPFVWRGIHSKQSLSAQIGRAKRDLDVLLGSNDPGDDLPTDSHLDNRAASSPKTSDQVTKLYTQYKIEMLRKQLAYLILMDVRSNRIRTESLTAWPDMVAAARGRFEKLGYGGASEEWDWENLKPV